MEQQEAFVDVADRRGTIQPWAPLFVTVLGVDDAKRKRRRRAGFRRSVPWVLSGSGTTERPHRSMYERVQLVRTSVYELLRASLVRAAIRGPHESLG